MCFHILFSISPYVPHLTAPTTTTDTNISFVLWLYKMISYPWIQFDLFDSLLESTNMKQIILKPYTLCNEWKNKYYNIMCVLLIIYKPKTFCIKSYIVDQSCMDLKKYRNLHNSIILFWIIHKCKDFNDTIKIAIRTLRVIIFLLYPCFKMFSTYLQYSWCLSVLLQPVVSVKCI